jgi:hypothetical protein
MPQCPQCTKPLVELSRTCPSCRADLELLVDYVNSLQVSLVRAEQLTRAGELGLATWAYLEVLETDPDNPTARRQVGQIATAVRQFDRTAPGRRWAQGLSPEPERPPAILGWIKVGLVAVVVMLAFGLGMFLGAGGGLPDAPTAPPDTKKDNLPPGQKHNQLGKPAG